MNLVQPEVATVPQRAVRIFTLGLDNFDNELVDFCHEWSRGGAEAEVPETMLRGVLKKRVGMHIDVLSDARMFTDPASTNLSRHIGQHPDILSRIAKMRNFPRWVEKMKGGVAKTLDTSDEACVAIYCRSGKHRSVALAWFLRCFCEHEGWLPEVRHLCESSWKSTCKGRCAECQMTSARSPQREYAMDYALGWWERSRPT